jgi:hypothetical protein
MWIEPREPLTNFIGLQSTAVGYANAMIGRDDVRDRFEQRSHRVEEKKH